MQGADQLLGVAEVGVALAGFTGIISVLGLRDSREFSEAKQMQAWLMLEFGLGTVFFSLLPFVPANLGASEALIWFISSGTMAMFLAVHLVLISPKILDMVKRGAWVMGASSRIDLALICTALIVQVVNLTAFLGPQSYGSYYLGVFIFVCLAADNFYSLMRGIWSQD